MRLPTLILAGWLVLLSATRELTAAPVEVERTVGALQLRRGAQSLLWYRPVNATIVGLCLLGSGDGGWSYWEERVAAHLAKKGWAVAGLDFAVYASADYTQHILAGDYERIVAELARRVGPPPGARARPVVYGGWSMGAEQALPAAADVPARPEGLRGLLLVAPGPRGRYGLHMADKLGIQPTGPGTFALADFAGRVRDLRLAQLHAGFDPLDSIDWFKDLGLNLRLWNYPRAFHDFDGADDEFFPLVDEAMEWIVNDGPKTKERP